MDYLAIIGLILQGLGLAQAATSGVDVDEETPAPPGGALPQDIQTIFGSGGQGGIPNLPPNIPDISGPVEATAAAAAATPKTQVTPPPQVPTGAETDATKEGKAGDIGTFLSSVEPVLVALAPLLGLEDRPIPTQTAAPIAGGQPGGPVGQFAQPFGQQLDIGRLLAALPGIRG